MVEQYVGWPAWGRGKRGLKVIQGESVYCPAAQIKLLLDSPLSSFYFGTQGLVCTPHSLSLLPCPFAGIDPFPKVRCENPRRRLGMKVFPEPLKADWFPSSAGENHGRKPGLGLRLTQPRREGRLQLPLGIGVRSKLMALSVTYTSFRYPRALQDLETGLLVAEKPHQNQRNHTQELAK
jgi:hypothetical protein